MKEGLPGGTLRVLTEERARGGPRSWQSKAEARGWPPTRVYKRLVTSLWRRLQRFFGAPAPGDPPRERWDHAGHALSRFMETGSVRHSPERRRKTDTECDRDHPDSE